MKPLFVLAAFVLGGCSHTYSVTRGDEASARVKIPGQASAYVAMPANGTFGGQEYSQSGAQTAEALSEALSRRLERVCTGDRVEEYDAALASARSQRIHYVFLPVIDHWEERATEWSGRPDRILVRILVFDANSGQQVDSADISGSSRFFTFGGDHPEELLREPIEEYLTTLF